MRSRTLAATPTRATTSTRPSADNRTTLPRVTTTAATIRAPTAVATIPTTTAGTPTPSVVLPSPVPAEQSPAVAGAAVLADLRHLCAIGPRRVGTAGNAAARDWLTQRLTTLGYALTSDTFVSTYPGNPHGTTLIASLAGQDPSRLLLIGAHYDTVESIVGCEDNATGVAALLEIARLLAGQQLPIDVQLVFFDSEEYGHAGSEHYAPQVADRLALMINLDCVGYGDHLYVYGPQGTADPTLRYALARAAQLDIDLTTHAGNAQWAAGTTGLWSDHAAFARRGLPYLYFEAANFAVATAAAWWGYTAEDPDLLHTAQDHPDYLLPRYGARMERHMLQTAILVADLAVNGFADAVAFP